MFFTTQFFTTTDKVQHGSLLELSPIRILHNRYRSVMSPTDSRAQDLHVNR